MIRLVEWKLSNVMFWLLCIVYWTIKESSKTCIDLIHAWMHQRPGMAHYWTIICMRYKRCLTWTIWVEDFTDMIRGGQYIRCCDIKHIICDNLCLACWEEVLSSLRPDRWKQFHLYHLCLYLTRAISIRQFLHTYCTLTVCFTLEEFIFCQICGCYPR